MNYESMKARCNVIYMRSGTFEFEGIKFNIEKAIFLADMIGEILTDKSHLISKEIPNEQLGNKKLLVKEIDKRLHSKDIPYAELEKGE